MRATDCILASLGDACVAGAGAGVGTTGGALHVALGRSGGAAVSPQYTVWLVMVMRLERSLVETSRDLGA